MAIFWYNRDASVRKLYGINEMNKLVLKSLLSNSLFQKKHKVYFGILLFKHVKESSISYYRSYCVLTGHAKSVSRKFKMCRHQCKSYAANGLLVGLRKAQF
jgi:ribosomal protein S14